jgi:hypothetical protein
MRGAREFSFKLFVYASLIGRLSTQQLAYFSSTHMTAPLTLHLAQFHPAQNFHPQQLPPGHPASCNYYLLIIPVLVFSIYADPKPCSMLKELLFV